MIPNPAALGSGGGGTWTLTLSANEDAVNIKTKLEALYGSMSSAVSAVVTVNAGVKIGAPDANSQAMSTGTSWPSGSTLKIINYGMIRGAGGAGGSNAHYSGWPGGDALNLGINVTIDNTTTGNIFGGGGGGGVGANAGDGAGEAGGGGGGGGQGDDGGGGGSPVDTDYDGTAGASGSESGSGIGGNGGGGGPGGAIGGQGGVGGGWGSAGAVGGTGIDFRGDPTAAGATGGVAGKAIDKNGKSVTWIAGNNAVQVKGSVS